MGLAEAAPWVGSGAAVFGSGAAWPDLIVAALLALLGIAGGSQIVRQAWTELKSAPRAPATSKEQSRA